jgi:hypothetical protein
MIDRHDLAGLLEPQRQAPCVSIYQPTHRRHPENRQDPIRFRNQLRAVAEALRETHPAEVVEPLLLPLHALASDGDFWNHTAEGLAVFSAPGFFRSLRLPRPVSELAVVGESFHVKPLLRIVQSAGRFQVLALNRREIRLFEGNRDVLDETELAPGVPRTIEEALGEELTEGQSFAYSYGTGPASGAGGRRGAAAGPKTGGMRHGHGSRQDEIDKDVARFFRAVDRAVLEHHSRPGGLPLVLAALPEYHATFRSVSHNPHLADAGIEIDPSALALEEMRERAWKIIEPLYLERLAGLVERFNAARAAGRGDDRLPEVSQAAESGRVASLLLRAEVDEAELEERLDDLAEQVLRTGGEVVVVPAARMPVPDALAAIYRY